MNFTVAPSKAGRFAVAGLNGLTWISSAIVVGITGYFLNEYPHDQHLIFEMCIVSHMSQNISRQPHLIHPPVRHRPRSLDPLFRPPRLQQLQVLLRTSQLYLLVPMAHRFRLLGPGL